MKKRMNPLELFTIFMFFGTILFLWWFSCGCAIQPPTPPGPTAPDIPDTITKIIYKTNWLTTIAIIGIAISAAAFVSGFSRALPLFAGCVTILITILTISRYSEWIAFVGFAFAIIVFIHVVLKRNRAFKEVVFGFQEVKDRMFGTTVDKDSANRKTANEIMGSVQSPETEQLVQEVKQKMVKNGEISNV